MTNEMKAAFMANARQPIWGLSPQALCKIEDAIDGSYQQAPLVLSFKDAAEALGITAKNGEKTIQLWAKQGRLAKVFPPGSKRAIGVTYQSVRDFVERGEAKGDAE